MNATTTSFNSMTNIYCVAVDGSESSEHAFNLVLNELYKKGDRIYVVHITTNKKSTELPYDYQPETIRSKYDTKLSGHLIRSQYDVILTERHSNNDHALVQVNEIAIAKKCTLLVIGFHGHKLSNTRSELTKGISYIINNIKLPSIVVKENSSRKKKENNGFTWMSAIEDNSSKSFKAFQYSLNYVDSSKDRVVGVHVKVHDDEWASDVKNSFDSICDNKQLSNFVFCAVEKPKGKNVENVLTDLVNFNEKESFDFLILGHNSNKSGNFNPKSKAFPVGEVIKNSQANIFFFC